MLNVVGVKFKHSDKIYYFDSGEFKLKKGEFVIVETYGSILYRTKQDFNEESKKIKKGKKSSANSIEIATVKVDTISIAESIFKGRKEEIYIRKILRVATEKDLQQNEKNKQREKDAFKIFVEKAKKHNLKMKLIDVQITFDFSKVLFFFTADGRVDFRGILKDLAYIFKTRIELRQVGVRDEARVLSGVGICGRTLCCSSFLRDFHPVSIKMAKDQNISLNPTKISGVCGRLMCCLNYEQETYEDLNKQQYKEGDVVKTPLGRGEIISFNILKQTIKASIRKNNNDTPSVHYFNSSEVQLISRNRESRKIEELENQDLKDIID